MVMTTKHGILWWMSLLVMWSCCELSQARTLRHWWVHPDRDGYRLLQKGDPLEAAQTFENPVWRGAAYYKGGKYKEALATFSSQRDTNGVESGYNRGNALAHLGRFQEAIDAYDQVLKKDPNHLDAMHNKIVVEKLMKQANESKSSSNPHDKSQTTQSDNNKSGDEKKSNDLGSKSKNLNHSETKNSSEEKSDKKPEQAQGGDKNPKNAPKSAEGKQANRDRDHRQQGTLQEGDQNQSLDQWLQQVPDDPGGLLKQKFLRDFEKRRQGNAS